MSETPTTNKTSDSLNPVLATKEKKQTEEEYVREFYKNHKVLMDELAK